MLSQEVPFAGLEQTAVIYGVGANSLHLPVPVSFPPGLRVLITMCLSPRPRARPAFEGIAQHLQLVAVELEQMSSEQLAQSQLEWRAQIASELQRKHKATRNKGMGVGTASMRNGGLGDSAAEGGHVEKQLVDQRKQELQHASVCTSRKSPFPVKRFSTKIIYIIQQLIYVKIFSENGNTSQLDFTYKGEGDINETEEILPLNSAGRIKKFICLKLIFAFKLPT